MQSTRGVVGFLILLQGSQNRLMSQFASERRTSAIPGALAFQSTAS